MTDQMAQLLTQLAEKLGTTAEHLWGVLIVQARIEVFVDLFYVGLVGAGIYVMLKLHRRYWSNADDSIPVFVFGWAILAIVSAIVLLEMAEIPGLLLNPEYWALKQILASVHK